MKKSMLKKIGAGILTGATAFFLPFLLIRVMVFFLIAGLLFRLFIRRKMGKHFGGHPFQPAFADKIRNMNEEEYQQFKQNFKNRCGHLHCQKETATK